MGKGESAPAGEGGRFARRMSAAGIAVIFAGVMALSVWRAATQSVVHDEALTYNWFAGRPLIQMFNYDANHHILHTWLVRASVSAFGVSELTLRLPALAGAALYLAALAWFVVRTLPAGPWRPAAFALGAGNPLLLDFFACARGYGLALGFLMLALAFMVRHLSGASSRRDLAVAGLALGGSVATNLAFAFPVVAAVAAFLFLDRHAPGAPRSRADDAAALILWTLPTGWIVLTCGVSLGAFYAGHPSCVGTLIDLFNASFFSTGTVDLNPGGPAVEVLPRWAEFAAAGAIGAAVAAVAAVSFVKIFRRHSPDPGATVPGAALLSATACLATALIFAANLLAGVKFPLDRMAIYFVPLVTLSLVLGLAAWTRRPRAVEWGALALAILACASYASQLRVSCYHSWTTDADARGVFEKMESMAGGRAGNPVSVFGAWYYEPSINFYRLARHADWLEPFPRGTRRPIESFDFLVVDGDGAARMKPLGFVPVYIGDVSGVILCANAKHGFAAPP